MKITKIQLIISIILGAIFLDIIILLLIYISSLKNTQISFIANIAAVLSFLAAIGFFITGQIDRINDRKSRFSAFIQETKINILATAEILKSLNNNAIPESRFELTNIRNQLTKGEIDKANLINVWNAYRLMKSANSLLNQAIDVQRNEHLIDPQNSVLTKGRRTEVNRLKGYAKDATVKSKCELEKIV